ncbi:MAG: hypothetical protein A2Y24_07935 [Clostridiales bacterium GWE2_32_10]|nr:MAG: hypothetical protein A2Y24_07935 [Clostridiales bacterium GWE2_32_10]HBY20543.1 O-methyltransferase [Clostridiales bacterium]
MAVENKVVYEYIEEYIRQVQPDLSVELEQIRLEAERDGVPIVKPEVASLILTLLAIKRPKRILEIGTAVGFSACLMSKHLDKDGKIITIERNNSMHQKATENIKRLGLEDSIKLIYGDAKEEMRKLSGEFDVIFIDAAKGQYDTFYRDSLPILADGGLIIADNILYKGLVALEKGAIDRRNRTIYKRMREFIKMVMNNLEFESTLIPVGDGIIISKKLEYTERNDKLYEQDKS